MKVTNNLASGLNILRKLIDRYLGVILGMAKICRKYLGSQPKNYPLDLFHNSNTHAYVWVSGMVVQIMLNHFTKDPTIPNKTPKISLRLECLSITIAMRRCATAAGGDAAELDLHRLTPDNSLTLTCEERGSQCCTWS